MALHRPLLRLVPALIVTTLLVLSGAGGALAGTSGVSGCGPAPDPALVLRENLLGDPPDGGPVPDIRRAYVTRWDPAHHVPAWSAWQEDETFRQTPPRKGRWSSFRTDPEHAEVNDRDYVGWMAALGLARGHIVPFAIAGGDRDGDGLLAADPKTGTLADPDDACALYEINSFSNIAPQYQDAFNGQGGLWFAAEEAERDLMERGRRLMIMAGTVFLAGKPVQEIGDRRQPAAHWEIGVPHGFWRLVVDPAAGEAVAFLFDHEGDVPHGCAMDAGQLARCIVPIVMLEAATGLHFWQGADPALTARLRSGDGGRIWQRWISSRSTS